MPFTCCLNLKWQYWLLVKWQVVGTGQRWKNHLRPYRNNKTTSQKRERITRVYCQALPKPQQNDTYEVFKVVDHQGWENSRKDNNDKTWEVGKPIEQQIM